MPTGTGDQFALYPPSTFDRADGLDGRPGTPTTDGFMVNTSKGAGYFLEEEPDSPEIERAEQGTIVHKFRCDPNTAQALISTIGRGYTFEDSFGNTSRCVNARLAYSKGLVCGIQITAESLNWDWPPDEFSLEVTELNPSLAKHPRYDLLSYKQRFIVAGNQAPAMPEYPEMYLNLIKQFPTTPTTGLGGSNPQQQALELAFKLHREEDSFYLPGFRVVYAQYFSIPVPLNPGGYIEDPIGSGVLPYYFWSTATPQNTDESQNIFSQMASINPTIYGSGIQWLRLCDTIQYQRTWFRVQSSWQGAPLGHWDNELYNRTFQSYQTSEDQGTIIRP